MAVTASQKNAFISAFRIYSEAHRRVMDQAQVLSGLYTDLQLATLVDADLTGDNAGLAAQDVRDALSTAGAILGEYTAVRRAAFNKVGHGAP